MLQQKSHWETVYETKQPNEVSWTQEKPQTSLDFIHRFNLPKTAAIIDIGGGDSRLVDYLLDEGFQNVTVLDISAKALQRAQERLGTKAASVKWIESDINDFNPAEKYDLWHDRAAFHFLTTEEQVNNYINTVGEAVSGYLVMGTFSENGPKKCSGLEIKQYSQEQLTAQFSQSFEKVECITEDHTTPFNTIQNFTFCSYKKKMN